MISSAGLVLLAGLFAFAPLLDGGSTHLAVMVIRLLVLLLAGVFLLGLVTTERMSAPPFQVGRAVLAFLLLAGISAATSAYMHQSLQWVLVLLSYGMMLYLLVFFTARWDHVLKVLAMVVAVGLLEGGYAIAQAWWLGIARPAGTFFNPNYLAGYLAAIVVVLLGVVSYDRLPLPVRARRGVPQRRHAGPWGSWPRQLLRSSGLLGMTILLLALIATGSRGGMLAFIAGSVFVVAVRFGRKAVVALLLLVIVGVLVPNPLHERVQGEHAANPVTYARWHMWTQAFRAMMDHPFGVGLGLYQYVSPAYAVAVDGQIARYGKIARTPHNEYLQMGAELGLAAPIIFGWGVFLFGRQARAVLKHRLKRWQRGAVVGMIGGTIVLLAHAAVDSTFHEPALAILLIFLVGMILAAHALGAGRRGSMRTLTVPSPLLWAGVGLLGCVVLATLVVRMGLAWLSYEAGTEARAQGHVAEAVAKYQRAVNLDSRKALYRSSLAAAHFHVFKTTGDHAAAIAALDELQTAIELNPLDGRLFGILGHVYISLASSLPATDAANQERTALLNSSVAAFERAIELQPYSPFHRLAVGRLYLARGERERAEGAVREAVNIEPNFLPGRAWLATLYLDAREPEGRELVGREYQEIRERQERYAAWPKDTYEERLLAVKESELQRISN